MTVTDNFEQLNGTSAFYADLTGSLVRFYFAVLPT